MTFEEFISDRVNVLSPQEYHAVEDVWNYQQNHIDKLEWNINNVRYALKEQKKLNSVLNSRIEALQAQLEVADIRPMEESGYLERIEELEEHVEWHKRRAEGWRSIAVLEEQGK